MKISNQLTFNPKLNYCLFLGFSLKKRITTGGFHFSQKKAAEEVNHVFKFAILSGLNTWLNSSTAFSRLNWHPRVLQRLSCNGWDFISVVYFCNLSFWVFIIWCFRCGDQDRASVDIFYWIDHTDMVRVLAKTFDLNDFLTANEIQGQNWIFRIGRIFTSNGVFQIWFPTVKVLDIVYLI